jgi:hypothetical protein
VNAFCRIYINWLSNALRSSVVKIKRPKNCPFLLALTLGRVEHDSLVPNGGESKREEARG